MNTPRIIALALCASAIALLLLILPGHKTPPQTQTAEAVTVSAQAQKPMRGTSCASGCTHLLPTPVKATGHAQAASAKHLDPTQLPKSNTLITASEDKRWPDAADPVKRSHVVKLNNALLSPQTSLAAGQKLYLPLFEDARFSATLTHVSLSPKGILSVRGHLDGTELGTLALTAHNGRVLAYVNDADNARGYEIRCRAAEETHYVVELDQSQAAYECQTRFPNPNETQPSQGDPSVAAASRAAATIDVMIVFDTTATTWANANGGMDMVAAQAVNKANLAFGTSAITLTLNAVHALSTPYTYSGDMGVDLDNLTGTADGNMDSLHATRNTYGADLVTLFVDTGSASGWIGLAWVLNNLGGQPNQGFSVFAVRAVNSTQVMTHELMHNLSCGHSKNQVTQPGPGPLYTYSAGHYFTGSNGTKYHTVMAYNNDGHGNSYTGYDGFSNPAVTHQSTATGVSNDADNRSCIENTKGIVAGYRSSTTVSTPDFSPAAGTYAVAQSVTLSSSTSGATIYYTTDGSTPSTASTQYAGAINVAGTTTLKAIAVKAGLVNSGVASATYTIGASTGTALSNGVTATGSTAGGDVQYYFEVPAGATAVTIQTTTTGNVDLVDLYVNMPSVGTYPTSAWTASSGATGATSNGNETLTFTASSTPALQSGMYYILVGQWNAGGAYTITASYTLPAAVATPTFSPNGGSYSAVQTVTLSCATDGATLYYTTNGSTPSASSTPYSGPITISNSLTLKAIALKAAMNNSAVASADFEISTAVQFSSPPTATPNPAEVNQTVSFACAVTPPSATLSWNFGDGSSGTGPSATHAYSAEGTYSVVVTATNGPSQVSATVTLTVVKDLGAIDSDGDGFSDEIETALGADPNDDSSTPYALSSPSAGDGMSVGKMSIKLNFSRAGSDSLSAVGTTPIPAGFSPEGQTGIANVGGVVVSFTLDSKGKAGTGANSFRLNLKTGGFMLKLSKGDFAAKLGLDDSYTGLITVPLTLIYGDVRYQDDALLSYTSRAGRGGIAK